MHNIFQFIDFKIWLAGCAFFLVSFSNLEIVLKILGSIIFIGYTARRWYLMEKNKENGSNNQ